MATAPDKISVGAGSEAACSWSLIEATVGWRYHAARPRWLVETKETLGNVASMEARDWLPIKMLERPVFQALIKSATIIRRVY